MAHVKEKEREGRMSWLLPLYLRLAYYLWLRAPPIPFIDLIDCDHGILALQLTDRREREYLKNHSVSFALLPQMFSRALPFLAKVVRMALYDSCGLCVLSLLLW